MKTAGPMGSRRGRARLLGMAIVPLLLLGGGWSDAPVADAAARGDLEAVRRLLREGADVNAPQGDGMTALHWAAERGDAELADVLLYAGARVDAGTRIGHYTPLHLASRRAGATVVEVLLDAGSDPNASTTNSGATPLHLAAATGDPAVVEVLVEAGADVNGREGAWGQTPLIFAAASNRIAAMEVLLGAGADLSLAAWSVDVAERERADAAADRRLNEFLADFKEKEGGGPEWQPTPSQVQAAIEASREIQRRWPDVPDPTNDGRTMANQEGQIEAEEEEGEESGTEADAASEAGDDAGEAEADSGEPAESGEADEASEEAEGDEDESADDEGGDPRPDEEDEEPRPMSYAQMVGAWGGLTPLLHAIRQGHVEATLTLLEAGAEINQVSEGDQTSPLLMASVNGQFDLALTLLESGADPNLASHAGTTPLFAVLERQWAPRASYAHPTEHLQQNATHLEVLEALLEAGADPNVRLKAHLWFMEYTFGVLRGSGINLQGATPFWRAAYALDVDAMRLLKEHGADPGIPTMKPPQRRRRRPPPPPSRRRRRKRSPRLERVRPWKARRRRRPAKSPPPRQKPRRLEPRPRAPALPTPRARRKRKRNPHSRATDGATTTISPACRPSPPAGPPSTRSMPRPASATASPSRATPTATCPTTGSRRSSSWWKRPTRTSTCATPTPTPRSITPPPGATTSWCSIWWSTAPTSRC